MTQCAYAQFAAVGLYLCIYNKEADALPSPCYASACRSELLTVLHVT
jgi:hypothetical protein